MKKILMTLALFSLLALASAQTLQTQGYNCPMGSFGGMMYGYSGAYGTSAMLFSWIISILLIVLIIVAIYWLYKSANKKR